MPFKADMKTLLKGVAILSLVTIAVLSLVPGSIRPHTGASGNVEHVMAYSGTAFLLSIAFPRLRGWFIMALLVEAAALFEIAQMGIPDRGPGLDNWIAGSFGAVIGTLAGFTLLKLASRQKARAIVTQPEDA